MTQEWFADLYDELRMRTGFGSVSQEQTCREVDFLWDVLSLASGSKVLDLFCGAGRHSIELVRRGCITTGIELNARYLEIVKEGAWRLYSPHEMKSILEGIGFRFLQAYSSLAKEPLTKDTHLMRLLFQRM